MWVEIILNIQSWVEKFDMNFSMASSNLWFLKLFENATYLSIQFEFAQI